LKGNRLMFNHLMSRFVILVGMVALFTVGLPILATSSQAVLSAISAVSISIAMALFIIILSQTPKNLRASDA
jgi:hypothetical protein